MSIHRGSLVLKRHYKPGDDPPPTWKEAGKRLTRPITDERLQWVYRNSHKLPVSQFVRETDTEPDFTEGIWNGF